MKEELEKTIKDCAKKAREASKSFDALYAVHMTQAALNAAQALIVVKQYEN